jgi:hypothetical protein
VYSLLTRALDFELQQFRLPLRETRLELVAAERWLVKLKQHLDLIKVFLQEVILILGIVYLLYTLYHALLGFFLITIIDILKLAILFVHLG